MTTSHRLTDLAGVRAFVGAGNAYFTLRNSASGGRVTYNVTREEDGTLTVRAFTGRENSDRRHYSYLGTVGADGGYTYAGARAAVAGLAAVAAETGDRWLAGFCANLVYRDRALTVRQREVLTERCRRHGVATAAIPVDDVRARGFAWFWANLARGTFPDTFEFWHEGRCAACARRLTVPQSIERGLGPECALRFSAIAA
jgi:hypothetical protein